MEHIKKRKQLLEEELKKSGGLVNGEGKPASNGATLLNAQGMPISSQNDKPMHFTEDLDQAMQNRHAHPSHNANSTTTRTIIIILIILMIIM